MAGPSLGRHSGRGALPASVQQDFDEERTQVAPALKATYS